MTLTTYNANAWPTITAWPDKFIDAIICDPPYDQPLNITELRRICRGNIITFCKPENQYFRPDEYLFWIKTPSTKNFRSKCGRFVEMILVSRAPNAPFNQLHWSQMTGVYDDRLILPPVHPYEKPLSLLERLLRIYTNPNDTILDPFMGSGTTLLAASNTGRNAIGFEIDGGHYQLALSNLVGKL